jgi:hypothetical protein
MVMHAFRCLHGVSLIQCGCAEHHCAGSELDRSRNVATDQISVVGMSWITIETYQITEA